MAEPILTSSNLNQPKVLAEAAREYHNGNTFAWAMGASMDAIIQVQIDESKGRGDTMYFSLREKLDPDSAVTGNSTVRGNEQNQTLRDDSVTIDEINHSTIVERKRIVDLRTPVEITGFMRPLVLDMATERLRNDIIDSAAVTATPHRSRVLFGALDSNFNSTLATALANVDTTNDKMTVAVIKLARLKALNASVASAGVTSRKIRPFKVRMDNGAMVETYVMFLDSVAAYHLQQDTDFQNLRDDARRNAISMPFFNGSKYLGEVAGVMCYEIEELARIESAAGGAGSTRVAHNLLCGAQAFGIGVGQAGRFATEDIDYERHVGINYEIIRGTKMLKFQIADGSSVENGVVHVFTSANAL